jgi:hypothetical protein
MLYSMNGLFDEVVFKMTIKKIKLCLTSNEEHFPLSKEILFCMKLKKKLEPIF